MLRIRIRSRAALMAALMVSLTVGTVGVSAENASAAATSKTVTISSMQGWQSTGVTVAANQRFSIQYVSGQWTVDSKNYPMVGPEGYPASIDQKIYQPCKPYLEHPFGYLMGTVNGSQSSYELHVGRGGTWQAPMSGTILLTINDNASCLGDNAGSITVNVTTR